MTDSEKTPLPEDPPVTIREDEVERLLQQAESLAGEIATEAGTESPVADAAPALESGPAVEDRDALAATEDIERSLDEVNRMLAEAGRLSEATAESAAEPGSGAAETVRAMAREGQVQHDGAAVPVLSSKSEVSGSSADAQDPSVEVDGLERPAHSSAYEFDPAMVGDLAVELSESALADGSDQSSLPVDGENPAPKPRRSSKELLLAGVATARMVGKGVMLAVPIAVLFLLKILDRPFAGLSPAVKRIIGFAGLATLVMGIAAWLVPLFYHPNPYEKLPPYRSEPAESAKSGEKSGEGEKKEEKSKEGEKKESGKKEGEKKEGKQKEGEQKKEAKAESSKKSHGEAEKKPGKAEKPKTEKHGGEE